MLGVSWHWKTAECHGQNRQARFPMALIVLYFRTLELILGMHPEKQLWERPSQFNNHVETWNPS